MTEGQKVTAAAAHDPRASVSAGPVADARPVPAEAVPAEEAEPPGAAAVRGEKAEELVVAVARALERLLVRVADVDVQHDLAATLRFDLNDFWIVKVEGHFMHGTELINGGDVAPDILTNPVNWGVFLVKTTGYF